jgi:hypothetical protein
MLEMYDMASPTERHRHATLLRSLSAFTCPGQDQVTLVFRKSADDRQHKLACRGGRVGPTITQRLEARTSLADCIKRVEQVPS